MSAIIVLYTLYTASVFFLFQEIVTVLKSAGETLSELSKDAPSDDVVNARAEQFVKSLGVLLT